MDRLLHNAAQQGALVLTVNDRLSRLLLKQYDHCQEQIGLEAWRRPDILSLSAWMAKCQREINAMPVFLNKPQLQRTWEEIVEGDIKKSGNELLQVQQAARRAMQAHQLLISHSADFDMNLCAEDHRVFLRWRKLWQERAIERGWHDSVELPWLIAGAVKTGAFKPARKIVLAGFDEVTPDLQNLFKEIELSGALLEHWQPQPGFDVSQVRVRANSPAEEVRLCARWVRGLLTENPKARIGVVVPQMEAYRSLLDHLFSAELTPNALIAGDENQSIYNMSLGDRLEREGVVHAALKLLRINMQVTHELVSWLLCCPYLGNAGLESADRALLDGELRRTRRFDWHLPKLARDVRSVAEKRSLHVPGALQCLETIAEDLRAASRQKMPGAWAEHFTNLLNKLGWPGNRGLSSREYQAVESFRSVLGELASLDGVAGPMLRADAVKALARLLNDCEFQPESAEAPVQILGELESAGMQFDHLWVLGLHEATLPRPPSPNPFIPLPIQRRYHMKRADVEREYQFAERIAARLFCAAPDIVVSWPAQDKGAIQRPSPFIADIPLAEPGLAESSAPALVFWSKKPAIEWLLDIQGPELSTRKPFSGGTGIIKDQALCPFRAFAHHRLKAEAMDTPDIGIDSLSRGSLAHLVLELFWDDVADHSNLLALADDELSEKVKEATGQALSRLERERRVDLPIRQRQIESERLERIALQWLAIEKQRDSFRVVEAEKLHKVKVGNLMIRTRIDRVDALADGTSAVIDYKTGRTDPSQWLDERVTEPQLPIYSLELAHDQLGAVMFAEVRSKQKECGFRGLARSIDSWPGAKSRKIDGLLDEKGWSGFDDVLQHWANQLPALGDAFARGDAAVDPVDEEKACKYCDLICFCRVLEQGGRPGDDHD